jgi:hypothetical protein
VSVKEKILRYSITVGALMIAVVHLIWPSLKIDAIAMSCLLIAIVPWLALLFKAVELPGGWKFEFKELERASNKADKAGLLAKSRLLTPTKSYSFQIVANQDPKLALAGLRIEIEKRLTEMAESSGVQLNKASVGKLLRILGDNGYLTQEQRSVLADMVGTLNAAVHGGDIDERAAEWALDVGPRLLDSLEAIAMK